MSNENSSGSVGNVWDAPADESTNVFGPVTSTDEQDPTPQPQKPTHARPTSANSLELENDVSTTPQPQQTPEQKKKFKLKVDNEDLELEEDEVVRRAQKASAADKKFQEAAQLRKQAEQMLEMLQQDPFSVLQHLGLDPTELSRTHLTKQLEQMRMTPEERELNELRQFRAEQERIRQEQEQARIQEEEQSQLAALSEQYTNEIIKALETVKLPRNESSVKEMVEIMQYNLLHNLDISWLEAAEMVKDNKKAVYKDLFASLDEDSLVELLGDDVVKKLVKRSTKKLYKESAPTTEQIVSKPSHRGIRKSVWDE